MSMRLFLIYTMMFSSGSMFGWCIELIFRRFFSKNNPERKWINPGFLNGPCLPLYGFGLCALYTMALLEEYISVENGLVQKLILFALMAIAMTIIEYIAGIIFIKGLKTKLWDYTNEWGNIQGIICTERHTLAQRKPRILVLYRSVLRNIYNRRGVLATARCKDTQIRRRQ